MEKDDDWTDESVIQNNFPSANGIISENINILSNHQLVPPKINSSGYKDCQRYPNKKQYCIFCETLVNRFARHLIRSHHEKDEVKEIVNLPSRSFLRKKKIDKLRCRGNYQFNHSVHRDNHIQIVARRSHRKNEPKEYTDCPTCFMRLSKISLWKHSKKCNENYNPNATSRDTYAKSKSVTLPLHSSACTVLRTEIFPYFRNDEFVEIIRNDYLAILYGNKLVAKYRARHHYKMIKSNLRYIGRFLTEMRKLSESISDLSSCLEPAQYDNVVTSIKTVAKFDDEGGYFNAPTTASTLGTILKFCSAILISECIKKSHEEKKQTVKNFLELLRTELPSDINRTVTENQVSNRRQKKVILPSTQDFQKFLNYLKDQRTKYIFLLKDEFTLYNWKQLASFTLVGIMIYNGRRPGETERILMADYKESAQSAVEGDSSNLGITYTRIVLRGKLMRNVTVVLNNSEVEAIELIIKYRGNAGVETGNPYIFGLPGSKPFKHLNAGVLLKKFAFQAELNNPNLFFATNIRKNLATKTAKLALPLEDREHIINFMGHSSSIHKNIYRQPDVEKDINVMPRVLDFVCGNSAEAEAKTHADVYEMSSNSTRVGEKHSTTITISQNDSDDLKNAKEFHEEEEKREYDCLSSDKTYVPSGTDTSESELEEDQYRKGKRKKLIGNVIISKI